MNIKVNLCILKGHKLDGIVIEWKSDELLLYCKLEVREGAQQ